MALQPLVALSAGLAGSLCDGDPTSEVIADTALGAPFGLAGAGLNAQRRESAERRVPLGGSLFRGAALEVPDDSLQAWPAASIAAFNGHGFLVRKPQYYQKIVSKLTPNGSL